MSIPPAPTAPVAPPQAPAKAPVLRRRPLVAAGRVLSNNWFRALLALMITLAAAAAGLKSDRWLANELGITSAPPPPVSLTTVVETPAARYIPGIVSMIGTAHEEIMLAVPKIAPVSVLEALAAAERDRNVRVIIVLSPDQAVPNQGTLGWLQAKRVGSVYSDKYTFAGVTLVVDRSFAFVSSVPVSMNGEASQYAGFAQLEKNRQVVDSLRKAIIAQAERGHHWR